MSKMGSYLTWGEEILKVRVSQFALFLFESTFLGAVNQ